MPNLFQISINEKGSLFEDFLFVEHPYKLSNRFISDLQKIHDYIGYFHINLTRVV